MALKLSIKAPGGFAAAEGYRRVVGLVWSPAQSACEVRTVDYRDEGRRRSREDDAFNPTSFKFGPSELPSQDGTERDDETGQLALIRTDHVPSFDQLSARPLGSFLPAVTADTTLGELLGAVGYALIRPFRRNAGAVDA